MKTPKVKTTKTEIFIYNKYQLGDAIAELGKHYSATSETGIDKPFNITIKIEADSKTSAQVRYYYGVVLPTALRFFYEQGYTPSDMNLDKLHIFFKTEFLYEEVVNPLTEKITKVLKSVARLTIKEMTEYIELVIHWCARAGMYIPPPMY